MVHRTKDHHTILYAAFENSIKRQIDQDIIYGKCWFFFDSELLKAIKDSTRGISINMDWFRELIKEDKLIVFTVSHDGIVEKKEYKDFDFLSKMSQTCIVAAETDDMILNRNKIKIFHSVIIGHGFTQEEIDMFESNFRESSRDHDDKTNFLIQHSDKRAKLYGYILNAVGALPGINQLLSRNKIENRSTFKSVKQLARALGIVEFYGGNQFTSLTKFLDKFGICKYFPGYLRNKDIWEMLKGRNLNVRQFDNVVEGKNDVFNGLNRYFPEAFSQDIVSSKEAGNDTTGFKTEDKDRTIDIIVNTVQCTIDDA